MCITTTFGHNTFHLGLRVMSEVYQQPQFQARRLEVILHLRTVFIRKIRHCFQFKNDFVKANEIRLISCAERAALVFQCERFLRHTWHALQS